MVRYGDFSVFFRYVKCAICYLAGTLSRFWCLNGALLVYKALVGR